MSDHTGQFEAQHVGEESDIFTRLVEEEFNGFVVPEENQMEQFESTYYYYEYSSEDDQPTTPLAGRTICVDYDPRNVSSEIIVETMLVAIDKFLPGHKDVKQVPDMDFEHDTKLFQGKDANGTDVLFVFDTREVGYNINHLSLIGPFDISEHDLSSLHTTLEDYFIKPVSGIRYYNSRKAPALQLCAQLNKLRESLREERARELDRRTDLVELIALSLLDPDTTGLSTIGADNLAVVTQMLMRM